MPLGKSRIKEKRLRKEVRDQKFRLQTNSPRCKPTCQTREVKKSQTLLSINILQVSLYILFTSTALKITVFRRCDAVYFGK